LDLELALAAQQETEAEVAPEAAEEKERRKVESTSERES